MDAPPLIDAGANAPADAVVGVDARALPRTAWGHATPIWWGTWSLMVIEGTVLVILATVYLYLRRLAPAWPPDAIRAPAMGPGTATVAVLLASGGFLWGVLPLAFAALLVWLARGYLPDALAGLQLRGQQVSEVWFDGVAWQVAEVGLLTSEVCRAGEFHRLPNRRVLEARLEDGEQGLLHAVGQRARPLAGGGEPHAARGPCDHPSCVGHRLRPDRRAAQRYDSDLAGSRRAMRGPARRARAPSCGDGASGRMSGWRVSSSSAHARLGT